MKRSNLTLEQIVDIEKRAEFLLKNANSNNKKFSLPPIPVGAVPTTGNLFVVFNELIKSGKKLSAKRRDVEILNEYLIKRGYQKKGEPDYPRFYKDACILQSTWNKYFNASHNKFPDEVVLKIVLALRMSADDAIEFMNSAGGGFYAGNERNMLILAFIEKDYLGLTNIVEIQNTVFDLIQYRSDKNVSNKKNPLKNIYSF